MTNKDTIEWLMVVKDKFIPKDDDWYDEKYREAIDKAIKALEQEPKETWSIKDVATTFERHGLMTEQEPCEDCISRAEALEAIRRLPNAGIRWFVSAESVFDALLKLQPVTPKPKTDVLDKIRTEIIQMPTISFNANDIYKADVLAIIDKYKTESEDKE